MNKTSASHVDSVEPPPQGEVLVTVLDEASFCGEIALVDPNTIRTATAVPVEKTVLIGFFDRR